MRVLIACEESQAVCIEFRKLGHEAYSADLQECSGGHPEWHYQGNVFDIVDDGWDLMVAHPPCTFLTVSGARWLYLEDGSRNEQRWKDMDDGLGFFKSLYNAPIPKVAVENPVGMVSSMFKKPDQVIHPYFFGDEAQKSTCLWLRGLPKLMHFNEDDMFDKQTHVSKGEMIETSTGKKFSKWYWETSRGKGEERRKIRSVTFPGIANAMASQWGGKVQ